MPDWAISLLITFVGGPLLNLIGLGFETPKPPEPGPPAIVAPEPAASPEEIARIDAEVEEFRQWLREQGEDPSGPGARP